MSKVTKKLIELRDNNLFEQQEYLKLKPTGEQPPRFYDPPKIQKDGTPVRPIISYTGTPLYKISKYIANILKPYGKLKKNNTHSPKSLSTFICQQKIEPDEVLVSFDVTSLYITIPIDQAILIIKDLLEHDDKLADRTLLSPRQILDLLDILPHTKCFKFNGDFYQQTDRATNRRSNFIHCFRSLYAIISDNGHHNSRPPSQSLGTPCRLCLFNSKQSLPTRTARPHQQFTFPDTIHQRRRKQLYSSIPRHLSTTKLKQNHLCENLQKTKTYKPVPEIHIS